MLKFSVQGIETIQEDFESQLAHIAKARRAGLNAVANDIPSALQRHIQQDVYDMYEPSDYERRLYGGGMIDDSNMMSVIGEKTLTFTYTFPTSPSFWKTATHWFDYQSGDDAIRAIQSSYRYPTVDSLGVKRPFWTNFIYDYIVGGGADRSFVKGINSFDSELRAVSDKQVSLDSEDRDEMAELAQMPNSSAVKKEFGEKPDDNDTDGYDDYDDIW